MYFWWIDSSFIKLSSLYLPTFLYSLFCLILVEPLAVILLLEFWGVGWIAAVQPKTTKEMEIEKFITHKSWRKYATCLRARTGRVRQGVGREKQDLGHMLLVGSAGRVLWNSWAIWTRKSRVWVSFTRVLSKRYTVKPLRGWGGLFITRATGRGVISVTYIHLWPSGLLSMAYIHRRGWC